MKSSIKNKKIHNDERRGDVDKRKMSESNVEERSCIGFWPKHIMEKMKQNSREEALSSGDQTAPTTRPVSPAPRQIRTRWC